MSESAANVKSFFVLPLRKICRPGTLPTAGAEDKALPGGNLSADSGARPRWGSIREPQRIKAKTGMALKRKIPEVWGQSPQKVSSL
jgi:hypothetical protein